MSVTGIAPITEVEEVKTLKRREGIEGVWKESPRAFEERFLRGVEGKD